MIVEQVRDAVLSSHLLGRERNLVVMVSGGRDSVCLLDVAVALRGQRSIEALHVNYGLRGESSDADERHCAALCGQLEVALTVVRAERGEQESGNLQAWARDVRYAAAIELAERKDALVDAAEREHALVAAAEPEHTLVAAGHTASDQVETILYRLAASPGRRALLGMRAQEGRLVRPLLGVTREQTGEYCKARGLAWREDQSNAGDAYARARVRHGLAAALRAVHPGAETNVLRTAQLLREETELLDGLVARELEGEGRGELEGNGDGDGDGDGEGKQSIALARLEELPPALARLVVVRLAEDAAGTYVPQAGDRVREILELGRRSSRGAGGRFDLHVGSNVSARIEDGRVRMTRLPAR